MSTLPSLEEVTGKLEIWSKYSTDLSRIVKEAKAINLENKFQFKAVKEVRKLFERYISPKYQKKFDPTQVVAEPATRYCREGYFRQGYYYTYFYDDVTIEVVYQPGYLDEYWEEVVKVWTPEGEITLYADTR